MNEQTMMCPKHGVAHGVCVDPMDASDTMWESPPPPHVVFNPRLAEEMNPKALNRFGPYEALDLIDRANFSPRHLPDSLKLVHQQVDLLRAYFTGMEKG